MKKLIIAATVAMLGIAVNAATANWNTNWCYSLNDGTDDTYNYGMSGTYWIVALGDGLTSDISVTTDGKLVLAENKNMSFQGPGSVSEGAAAGMLSFTDNGEMFALVIYNSDYQMFGVSDAAAIANYKADPPNPADDITFSNIHDVTYDSDYMVANQAAVPEPTSGLLLLLGVAGLALKRRRA